MRSIPIQLGQKFGRLTVHQKGPLLLMPAGKRHESWYCICECGKCTMAQSRRLREGTKRSCGCLQNDTLVKNSIRHGIHHTGGYRAWSEMMKRCYRPNHISYKNYGGRGIKVCDQWYNVLSFVEDMGHPEIGLSLDRKDSCKDYCKENCRWSDRKTQNRNKRATIQVMAFGRTKPLAQWAEEKGIKYETLRKRLRDGLSPEDAISKIVRPVFWKGLPK